MCEAEMLSNSAAWATKVWQGGKAEEDFEGEVDMMKLHGKGGIVFGALLKPEEVCLIEDT